MANSIDSLADRVGGLDLSSGTARQSPRTHPSSLEDATRSLIRSTTAIRQKVESVSVRAVNTRAAGNQSLTEICSLRGDIKRLEAVASGLQSAIQAFSESTERLVVRRLTSLGNQSVLFPSSDASPVPKLLSHFDGEIRGIARRFLDDASEQDMLWKIAEACYNESISGTLDAENYAESFREQALREEVSRDKCRESWPAFWVSVLNNAPYGPTLFYPPASHNMQGLKLDEMPRYLFRVFDVSSSGENNESVIASTASKYNPAKRRIDLVAMEKDDVVKLLDKHFTKSLFGGEASDNLMSWTSSLLFAIQYAIWRSKDGGKVTLCAVDTRKFPRGQFVQDIWLLDAYNDTAQAKRHGDPTRNFFSFRLSREDYYNGEYLSQGTVRIAGRSYIASFDNMMKAGLGSLYPSFAEVRGDRQWTNRVKELRDQWSTEQATTDEEILLALQVAHKCFPGLDQVDIASVLLGFKNRRYVASKVIDELVNFREPPTWAEKPVDVLRSWITTEATRSFEKSNYGGVQTPQAVLRKVYSASLA